LGKTVQQAGGAGFQPTWAGPQAAKPRTWVALRPMRALEQVLDAEQPRWFLWLPVMLGAGIALYFALAQEPSLPTALLPAVMALILRFYGWQRVLPLLATAAMLSVAVGFALAKLRTEAVRAPVLAKPVFGAQVDGFVELVEPRPGKGQRLTLRVIAIAPLSGEAMPARVRIRTQRETPDLKPGDAVRLKASLSPPPVPALPGDYDFARSAFFARLGAAGFASGAAERLAAPPEAPRLLPGAHLHSQDQSAAATSRVAGVEAQRVPRSARI